MTSPRYVPAVYGRNYAECHRLKRRPTRKRDLPVYYYRLVRPYSNFENVKQLKIQCFSRGSSFVGACVTGASLRGSTPKSTKFGKMLGMFGVGRGCLFTSLWHRELFVSPRNRVDLILGKSGPPCFGPRKFNISAKHKINLLKCLHIEDGTFPSSTFSNVDIQKILKC